MRKEIHSASNPSGIREEACFDGLSGLTYPSRDAKAAERLIRVALLTSHDLLGALPGVNELRTQAFHWLQRLQRHRPVESDIDTKLQVNAQELLKRLLECFDVGISKQLFRGEDGERMKRRLLDPSTLTPQELSPLRDAILNHIARVANGTRGHSSTESSLGEYGAPLALRADDSAQQDCFAQLQKHLSQTGFGRIHQTFVKQEFRNEAIYVFAKRNEEGLVSVHVVEFWMAARGGTPPIEAITTAYRPQTMTHHLHDDDRLGDSYYPMMYQTSIGFEPLTQEESEKLLKGLIKILAENPREMGVTMTREEHARMVGRWRSEFNCEETSGCFAG